MILLIRHATPEVEYSNCRYGTAKARLSEYNETTSIASSEIEPFLSDALYKRSFDENIKIYSSTTNRAAKTAQILFSNHPNKISYSKEFVEFDLNIVPIPFAKLSLRTWFAISRVLWLLGFNNNAVPKQKEKSRVDAISNKFLFDVSLGNTVFCVAHGYLIRELGKRLRNAGMKQSRIYKNGCFTVERFKH